MRHEIKCSECGQTFASEHQLTICPPCQDNIQEQTDRIQSKSRKQLIRHRAVRRARHKAA